MIARTAAHVARRAARAVRRVEHRVARLTGRRSILVEARTPMNLAVLRPVFERLMADPRVRVRFTGSRRADLTAAFETLGVASRVLARDGVAWRRFDLYMNADPWEAVTLHRVDKQVNFFHGVAGKFDLDCPKELPLGLGRYDRVAFPNEGRRDAYVAAGLVAASRAALIGFPKADALTTRPCDTRALSASLGLDATRATVIFAPTFSADSALNVAGEGIITTLLAAGCNVIAKLHDRSLDPDPRYTGGINWRERLARFNGPHFLLASGGDSTPYVLASDVMVTDHSSIGFEFCAADRPLIVFDVPDLIARSRVNPEKVALLRSAAVVVSEADQLTDAVRDALVAPQQRATERRHAANQVFFQPGTATDRALRLVYELIALPSLPSVSMAMDVRPARAA